MKKTSKKTSVKKTSVSPVLALVAHLISGVSLCNQGRTLPGSLAAVMEFPIYGGDFWSFQVVSLPLKLDVTLLTLETDPQFSELTPKNSWKLHYFTSLKSPSTTEVYFDFRDTDTGSWCSMWDTNSH